MFQHKSLRTTSIHSTYKRIVFDVNFAQLLLRFKSVDLEQLAKLEKIQNMKDEFITLRD
jgi:hypothetical protein